MIYRFNTIAVKILAGVFFFFLVNIDKQILMFIGKGKGTRIVKTILSKKNKIGRLTLPNFETYYNQDCVVLVNK